MSERRSDCPLAVSLDLLGDRWTLLVVRDLFVGKKRFAEFLDSPEKIATNILSERLRRLECAGVVSRHAYQLQPERYEYRLTRRGADMLPIIQAAVTWARRYFPDTWNPPEWLARCTPEEWWDNHGG